MQVFLLTDKMLRNAPLNRVQSGEGVGDGLARLGVGGGVEYSLDLGSGKGPGDSRCWKHAGRPRLAPGGDGGARRYATAAERDVARRARTLARASFRAATAFLASTANRAGQREVCLILSPPSC
jgi:hypothetical protein